MKQIFTLIITGMMVLTGMAQQRAADRLHRNHLHLQKVISEPGMRADILDIPGWRSQLQNKPMSGDKLLKSRVLMQQLDSYENQYYDDIFMTWVNETNNEFTYDASGNNTADILSVWNTDTEMYELTSKQELVYENGQVTEQLYFNYDANTMQWMQYLRWLNSYDTEGNLTISYIYVWNGSSWDMTARDVLTYDGEDFLISEVNSFWDEDSGSWINNTRNEYSYNTGGHLTVTTSFMWDMITEVWRNTYQYENIYEGDILSQSMSYTWDMINNEWTEEYMNEYTYDLNMNMVNNTEYEWDGSAWVLTWEADYVYNNDYTIDELVMPWFFDDEEVPFMHMLTGVTEYEEGLTVPSSRSTLHYSEVDITGVPVNEFAQATVYPQPASIDVTFKWANGNLVLDLDLFDISGKLVLEQRIEYETPVSIGSLAPGLYFYKLTGSNNALYTGKLSVR